MASFKKLSGYPENAVSWAIQQLPREDREKLDKTLGVLESFLGDKPGKSSETRRKLPSASELFEKHIIPIIKEGMRKLEVLDDQGKIQDLDESFDEMRTDLQAMSLDDLADLHKQIASMEKNVQAVDNFFKYYRGVVYLTVHNKVNTDGFSKWIQSRDVTSARSRCIRR